MKDVTTPPNGSNVLTRSKPFKALVNKAFTACDLNKSGDICRSELYSSLLFVHSTLARYAGPAACFVSSVSVFRYYRYVESYSSVELFGSLAVFPRSQ